MKAAKTPTPTRVQIKALVTKPRTATPILSNWPEQKPTPVFKDSLRVKILAKAMLITKAHIIRLTGL
jgi:hypothetical protein